MGTIGAFAGFRGRDDFSREMIIIRIGLILKTTVKLLDDVMEGTTTKDMMGVLLHSNFNPQPIEAQCARSLHTVHTYTAISTCGFPFLRVSLSARATKEECLHVAVSWGQAILRKKGEQLKNLKGKRKGKWEIKEKEI